jgi:hypothetical protein
MAIVSTGATVTPMRQNLAILLVLAPSLALAQQAPEPRSVTLYKTAASAACTDDATVWVDPATRLFHLKGDPAFGKTPRGGYNCRKQAEAAGYKPARSR